MKSLVGAILFVLLVIACTSILSLIEQYRIRCNTYTNENLKHEVFKLRADVDALIKKDVRRGKQQAGDWREIRRLKKANIKLEEAAQKQRAGAATGSNRLESAPGPSEIEVAH